MYSTSRPTWLRERRPPIASHPAAHLSALMAQPDAELAGLVPQCCWRALQLLGDLGERRPGLRMRLQRLDVVASVLAPHGLLGLRHRYLLCCCVLKGGKRIAAALVTIAGERSALEGVQRAGIKAPARA